ncbi:MAG: AmmeMemoRadiSam system protein B [Pseudomonadota bacterium]
MTSPIRPAAVAGQFYPAEKEALWTAVMDYLRPVKSAPGKAPKALIVPHAGYIYSGPVAASAYAQLRGLAGRIRRVVLIGPAHYRHCQGMVYPSAESFATPLGNVPVDRKALSEINTLAWVSEDDLAHEPEHGLEVQLPFLQIVLGTGFSVVPLLVGSIQPDQVREVIDQLWGDDSTLIIISSDLSHYLPYDEAKLIDARTASNIETFEEAHIGSLHACGNLAIRGLLRTAEARDMNAEVVDLRNSGDTAGPRDRVVGYAAVLFN